MAVRGSVKEAHLGFKETFLRYFSWCVVKTVQRPKVYGQKPVLDEPTIFVCRHVGLMDPVILMVEYFRMMVRPLVAKDYVQKNGFTRKFYPIAQCIPIDRYNPATEWVERSLEALGKGESLIIFPEGRRNKAGDDLLRFHSGAALLAAKSGARLVPVYNARWSFPHRYRLNIGNPIYLPQPPEGIDFNKWLQEQSDMLRDAVAELKI